MTFTEWFQSLPPGNIIVFIWFFAVLLLAVIIAVGMLNDIK
jgi:hypothetical protein